MLFGNEKLYSLVRDIKLGLIEVPPVFAQLRDWLQNEFNVSVIYIALEHVELGPNTGTPRLNVILETDGECDSRKNDTISILSKMEHLILSRFKKLVRMNHLKYDTEGIFLIVDNFSDECVSRACYTFLKTDADRIISEFSNIPIWKIDGFYRSLVVFLKTENDIRLRCADGTCERISNRCFDAVKPYDEFGYLSAKSFRLEFDSKENLDKNYNGSFFNYWR